MMLDNYSPVSTEKVPLTVYQKLRLLFDCLPFLFFLGLLLLFLTVLRPVVSEKLSPIILFVSMVLSFTGFIAVQRLRDVISGVAEIRVDTLLKAYRSGGYRSSGHYYGKFERLGRKRLTNRAFSQGSVGGVCRLVYSPFSQLVWSMEVADRRYSGSERHIMERASLNDLPHN